MAKRGGPAPADADAPVVRRAPFAVNPAVGERGKQAQRRILDAALKVFGEVGYEQCRVGRITEAAGCSRVAFYQYFSSKEDVFRQLSAIVNRELDEAVASVGTITPDAAGHRALADWFARYGAIYDRYEPVYAAFPTATSRDAELTPGAGKATSRTLPAFDAHVSGSPLGADERRAVLRVISELTIRANRYRELVEAGEPPVALSHERLNEALADVVHRALFGLIPAVNTQANAGKRLFRIEPAAWDASGATDEEGSLRAAVLEAAHNVFLDRGFHAARIDDIAEQAGVSHGAMYRYFRTKSDLFRVLAAQAADRFNRAFDELSELVLTDSAAATEFRRWVRDYAATCADAAAIMRVWAEALARDPNLGSDSAAAIRYSCSRLAKVLAQRDTGDADAEALAMLAMLEAIATIGATVEQVDIGADAIERSLLLLAPARRSKRRAS